VLNSATCILHQLKVQKRDRKIIILVSITILKIAVNIVSPMQIK